MDAIIFVIHFQVDCITHECIFLHYAERSIYTVLCFRFILQL
jgi:hypothetical protein